MNLRLKLLPLFFLAFILTSATSISLPKDSTGRIEQITALPKDATSIKKQKLNFFERLLVKYSLKKYFKAEDPTQANKQARTSQTWGIIAISTLVVGLIVPYIIFGVIPAGIVAITSGNSALKGGTTEESKARLGKGLGLGSIIAFGAILVLALILVAAFLSGWH